MAGALLTFIGMALSGLLLFFGFFIIYRAVSDYLIAQKISDTPTSKIRSAAMGLVELSGAASSTNGLNSHLNGRPCVFSRLIVEKYSRFKKTWIQVGAFDRFSRFHLKDASGRVLVDPSKADYDFAFQSSVIEVFLKNDGRAATNKAEIAETLAQHQSQLSFGPIQDYILGGKDTGYSEIITATRIISSLAPATPHSKSPPPGLESALMLNRFLDSDASAADGFRMLGSGETRLTEKLIPAGSKLYVLGTAEAKDGGGKPVAHENLLMHRGRGGVLLISDKSEKSLLGSKTAIAMVLAAGGIAVIALSLFIAFQFI